MSIKIETLVLDNIFYTKLSDLPALEFLDTTKINNQWIRFDISKYKSQDNKEILDKGSAYYKPEKHF